jgi:phage baseplate assembly protein W
MNDEVRGFAFPFLLDPETGGILQANGARKIKENITQLLLTRIGERVMRQQYGGGIQQLVHDPNNDALQALVHHQITKAISSWEPRVLVQNVRVTQREGILTIELQYMERQTQQFHVLTVHHQLGVV